MSDDTENPFGGPGVFGPKTQAEAEGKTIDDLPAGPPPPIPNIQHPRIVTQADRNAEHFRLAQWTEMYTPMIASRSLRILSVGQSGAEIMCACCQTSWCIPTHRGPSEKHLACLRGCNGGGAYL
jgi:hypothetical protein